MGLFTAHRDRLMTLTYVVSVCVLVIAQTLLLPLAELHGALIDKIVFHSVAILTMRQPSVTDHICRVLVDHGWNGIAQRCRLRGDGSLHLPSRPQYDSN
jgi:hypothetical protein